MKTLRIPFQIDARGGLAVVEDTRSIVEQQITDIVVTGSYERVMNPMYGAGLPQFLFAPMLNALLTTKSTEISALLSNTVRLATIRSVRLYPIPGRQTSLALDIQYSINPSPEVFSMTRTVTGLVSEETFGGEIR